MGQKVSMHNEKTTNNYSYDNGINVEIKDDPKRLLNYNDEIHIEFVFTKILNSKNLKYLKSREFKKDLNSLFYKTDDSNLINGYKKEFNLPLTNNYEPFTWTIKPNSFAVNKKSVEFTLKLKMKNDKIHLYEVCSYLSSTVEWHMSKGSLPVHSNNEEEYLNIGKMIVT